MDKLKTIQPKLTVLTETRVDDVPTEDWKKEAFTFLASPATIAGAENIDVVINCAFLHFDTDFIHVGSKDNRGCLEVNEHYQLQDNNNIFVIGDVASRSVKMAYVAAQQVCFRDHFPSDATG